MSAKITSRAFPVSGGFAGVLEILGVLGGRGGLTRRSRGYIGKLGENQISD